MAYNASEKSYDYTPEELNAIAKVAADILAERDVEHRRQGGITPKGLQDYVGRYYEAVNPGFAVRSWPDIMRDMAENYNAMMNGESDVNEMQYGSAVVLLGMHFAHVFSFDLYEMAYEYFDQVLHDQIQWSKEVNDRALELERIASNTVEEGENAV